jgi:general secretion pathway protein G
VELLIVIVVLGILAGIVLFAVGSFRDGAETSAVSAETRTVRTAVAAYRVRHGADAVPTITDLVNGDYLRSEPSYVTLVDGEVTPLEPTTTTTTSSSTSSTTTTTVPPASMKVAVLAGTASRSGNSSNFSVLVSVTVTDAANVPVSGAAVAGSWSDSVTPAGCTTVAGTCTFTSTHAAPDTATARTWTVSALTKDGYASGAHAATTLTCRRSGTISGVSTCSVS